MSKPFATHIDLLQNELQNGVIQNLASDPGSPVDGQIWYNTTEDRYKGRQNAVIISFATLAEVTAAIEGVAWKNSVRVATTDPGALATDFENGDTIDGVVLVTNDRILIKDQAAGAENGVYIVQATGAPVRADDMNIGAEFTSATVPVDEGTANGDTSWRCTNENPTIGVDPITFVNFGSTLPIATTTIIGRTRRSTDVEAETKSSTDSAVSPSNLTNYVISRTFPFAAVSTDTIPRGTIGNPGLGEHGFATPLSVVLYDNTNTEVEVQVTVDASTGDVTWIATAAFTGRAIVYGI